MPDDADASAALNGELSMSGMAPDAVAQSR